MNFQKAIDYLVKGRKIRRRIWRPDIYLSYDGRLDLNGIDVVTKDAFVERNERFSIQDVLATDWELY